MTSVYNSERVARLSQISTKFHAHAAVGDTIWLGIEGDDQMPARYRGDARPRGTIIKIKNEGTENSTLRVQLDSGRQVDLHPYHLAGDRVWEFTDESWPKVLARSNPQEYRSSRADGDDIASMRQQMQDMSQRFDREMAQAKHFNNALVESIAQITDEIQQTNKDAKFSKVFQQEYRQMTKQRRESSPVFNSDFEDSDDDM